MGRQGLSVAVRSGIAPAAGGSCPLCRPEHLLLLARCATSVSALISTASGGLGAFKPAEPARCTPLGAPVGANRCGGAWRRLLTGARLLPTRRPVAAAAANLWSPPPQTLQHIPVS